ncbi:carbamoyl-phosphate synthase, large subunit [Caldalkalibacillus thermarum TA2.A1]|uniref:Carbamoyl phosphate synthase large chain n=1 Tax=Caldalkalibacillus thermarum (strain TA2.A1) TaxID=986075 RepID=F5L465_CALTT|nr:carbamoyl-phosphate synthase (glutamine-hydrolyzing) large subunit [Caldalkalibacillus thermarum]EGL83875.1 carbamoyl-phosphate synthase, large subunit [Caldalkalibacillus thermarum TA2.A1]QZT34724.1 carbamoyl-phosphate synthase (glutamine-hydrolyzing) large subunit [Caldalkalibacillus thermarum TA2.A1]
MPLRKEIKKVLVIGSGPIIIGQAAEFDYAGTQACLALKEEGIEVVLVNPNPATIMTDEQIADRVYLEPLTVEAVETIIQKEKPDGLIGTLGGQTGLNLTVQLAEQGILDRYGVEVLGTSIEAIQKGEDRELFRQLMLDIGEPVPESQIVDNVEEGLRFAQSIGYPVITRPAYTLGGSGGGVAENEQELERLLKKGLKMSPIQQVLVEKSIKGWKEIEYEIMRDANDTCITVCNMENMDPVGIHTGDSIVVAPSQTLTDKQYQVLRQASLKVIRALGVIGGCNIQFALDPESDQYYIIEVNPRVSRSSALASKATGYPIARIATKCAIGYHLDELLNPITGNTYAAFEPAIDYVVLKIPRFPFDKFSEADRTLGTQMKATGEVMAIDRTFEGALNKAIRSLEVNTAGLEWPALKRLTDEALEEHLAHATDLRLFALAEAFRRGWTTQDLYKLTQIDPWFLEKIKGLIEFEENLKSYTWGTLPNELLTEAKQKNMADRYLARLFQVSEREIRQRRKQLGLVPVYKQVDTCAGEFEAVTPYYYSTWHGQVDEVESGDGKKMMVIGSGPIRIGQGVEFDYCSVHATLAVKKQGYEAIVINNNPETVSTDYSVADRLYFEPLTVEDILHVIDKEQVEGVFVQFGGQTAIKVAEELAAEGVPVLGTSVDIIDKLEDREQFYNLLNELEIPHIKGATVHQAQELYQAVETLGFPVLVRPSYVIGGQSMFLFHRRQEVESYLEKVEQEGDERIWPLLVDAYVPGLECEMDIISDGQTVVIPGIFEHVERAGVHSGDSLAIFPPPTLPDKVKQTLADYAERIATKAPVVGMMNIQFVVDGEQVYVLEVNPRASRTVPIISKVTGVPMIEWATRVQLGETLEAIAEEKGLMLEPAFYTVKAPVFSTGKLKDVDPALGPEMKSTGEILGLGLSVAEAVAKAMPEEYDFLVQAVQPASHNKRHTDLQQPGLLCAIADRDKEAVLPLIQRMASLGIRLLATSGTARFLQSHGLHVQEIDHDLEQVEELMKHGQIGALFNSPNQGRVVGTFGFSLRQIALVYQLPCFTCPDTLRVLLDSLDVSAQDIRALSDYRNISTERVLSP